MGVIGRRLGAVAVALAGAALALVSPRGEAAVAEVVAVTPTFEAAGLRVSVAGDPEANAAAALYYRRAGDEAWRPALPMARLDGGRFAGSLFGLAPGTQYEARVVISDPDAPTSSEIAATFRTREEPPTGDGGRVWHVAPTGRTGARGGPTTPLKSIQQAVDRAGPGDVILVQPGVYHEAVTIRRSGQPGRPIVIRAAGPGVLLDGAEPRLARLDSRRWWRPEGGGLYSVALADRPGYVAAGEQRLYPYDTLSDLRAGAAGIPGGWFYDIAARRLYVALPDGGDPDAVSMRVARLPHAFLLDGVRHVQVKGFQVRCYGVNAWGKGIFLLDASHCVVRGNRIWQANRGIWVKGAARENLIEGNEIEESGLAGWPRERVKDAGLDGAAIMLTGGPGNVVRGNRIRGSFDGILASTWGDFADETYNTDLDIHDNEIRDVGDRALAVEGAGINVRLWGNRVHDARVALALGPVIAGPCYAVRNVATGFRLAWATLAGAVGPCLLLHNSAASDQPNTRGIATAGPWLNLATRNNAVEVTGSALEIPFASTRVTLDHDAFFTTGESAFALWDAAPLATLADFQAATGQERTGLDAAPGFVDPIAGDLRLLPESPLRDRALLLPNINDDAPDSLPDIGAFEG